MVGTPIIAVLDPATNAPDAEPDLVLQLKQASRLSHMDFFRNSGPGLTAGLSGQRDHQNESERFREDIRRRHETPFSFDYSLGGLNEESD